MCVCFSSFRPWLKFTIPLFYKEYGAPDLGVKCDCDILYWCGVIFGIE